MDIEKSKTTEMGHAQVQLIYYTKDVRTNLFKWYLPVLISSSVALYLCFIGSFCARLKSTAWLRVSGHTSTAISRMIGGVDLAVVIDMIRQQPLCFWLIDFDMTLVGILCYSDAVLWRAILYFRALFVLDVSQKILLCLYEISITNGTRIVPVCQRMHRAKQGGQNAMKQAKMYAQA